MIGVIFLYTEQKNGIVEAKTKIPVTNIQQQTSCTDVLMNCPWPTIFSLEIFRYLFHIAGFRSICERRVNI